MRRFMTWLGGFFLIGGILLAGSEGPHFWPNLLGLILLVISVYIINKEEAQ